MAPSPLQSLQALPTSQNRGPERTARSPGQRNRVRLVFGGRYPRAPTGSLPRSCRGVICSRALSDEGRAASGFYTTAATVGAASTQAARGRHGDCSLRSTPRPQPTRVHCPAQMNCADPARVAAARREREGVSGHRPAVGWRPARPTERTRFLLRRGSRERPPTDGAPDLERGGARNVVRVLDVAEPGVLVDARVREGAGVAGLDPAPVDHELVRPCRGGRVLGAPGLPGFGAPAGSTVRCHVPARALGGLGVGGTRATTVSLTVCPLVLVARTVKCAGPGSSQEVTR